jgi:hypothetical protein
MPEKLPFLSDEFHYAIAHITPANPREIIYVEV